MKKLLSALAALGLLATAAVAQIETPGTGGGSGGGGGSGVITNDNQFGASTTLTIKDTPLITNLWVYGNNTNALRINSGVITSSLPALDVIQTWSNSGVAFTGLKLNVNTSNSSDSSILLDLQTNGVSQFSFNKNGQIVLWPGSKSTPAIYSTNTPAIIGGHKSGIYFGAGGNHDIAYSYGGSTYFRWFLTRQRLGSGSTINWMSATETDAGAEDLVLGRDAAAVLQLGSDAATTTTQTIKSHDGSGTDKAGATFQIRGGQGTGAGVGGALAHHTSLTGGSGSSLNSYSTRGYAYAGEKSITDATATGVADITIASGKYVGCDLLITYKAADGFGGWSVNTIRINLSAYNDAGTINAAFSTQQASVIHSLVGTETIGFSTSSPSAGIVRISTTFTSDSWAEPPSIKCKWQLLINSDDVATVTPL